nr:reverse transcriptase domain-containing protein [Tanacetum cinerariifolium]
IKNRLLAARSRQKSYAYKRPKLLEFKVDDMVLLKVSPWKGVVHFGKSGKLSLHYIGPFKILARVGPIANTLELHEELKGIHSTFHVLNLKKCLAEATKTCERVVVNWSIDKIKNRLLAARSRQKSYAYKRPKLLEFKVDDMVLLKVSPWKGVVHFGKREKLSLHYIGPFKILARVGPIANTLELPEELK